MNSSLLILDLKKYSNDEYVYSTIAKQKDIGKFVALTPYAAYIFDKYNLNYDTFHSYISKNVFSETIDTCISEKCSKDNHLSLNIFFIKHISNSFYYKILNEEIIPLYDKVIYITDSNKNIYDGTNNSICINIKQLKYIMIRSESKKRSIKNKKFNLSSQKIVTYIKRKLFDVNVRYDWIYFIDIIYKYKKLMIYTHRYYSCISIDVIIKSLYCKYHKLKIKNLLEQLKRRGSAYNINFTTISNEYEIIKINDRFNVFFQHGNSFYKYYYWKYAEVELANINFVFNDYTKKWYEELGAKHVYSVGSILFNKSIRDKKKKYDFLYVTQGHDYTGNLQYVDFPNSLHSFDGYELYQRHKNIINLFGIKFKDRKIIIRVHPTVVTNGVYVPFWELAEPYPNITIDVSIPIHTLIEKSKYIISDYFTTEFINRELHYKRDIILFQGAPTPLPEETLEDMKKMFILVDTIDDLEEKVKDIEKITKNRKRYDDIIEYYSSKKCDTKKLVTEILEKELNART